MQRRIRKNVQSPDLNQTKVTPRTRATHQAAFDGKLIKADPEKKYVLAPKDEQHPMSYAFYESIGYELVKAEKDGVRINLGSKPIEGKPLEFQGLVLLSCSKERSEEIFQSGPNGLTGQNYYDKLMENIRKGTLEKRENFTGLLSEDWSETSDLQQNKAPNNGVFRE